MKSTVKSMLRTTLAIGGSITLLMSIAPVATAATARNGICEDYEFCLYHGLNFSGSVSDFAASSIANYGATQPDCYEFRGTGTGQGECVKNNAQSARNRTHIYVVKVYYNSDYKGTDFAFNPGGETRDLGALKKQNASQLVELVS